MNDTQVFWWWLFGIALLFIAFAVLSHMDYNDAVQQESLYCEMVAAWHESNGEFGWPPYNGECK